MDIPIGDAIKNIPFIVLGIWPINLLTLLARDHTWGWDSTPESLMGLWEWGAFISLSLVILIELGVEMFIALGRHRRRMEHARNEGRKEGLKEARKETRKETNDMLMVLNAAARENPDLLPTLLEQFQDQYQNGSANG
jgi:uncharacterized membrane protein